MRVEPKPCLKLVCYRNPRVQPKSYLELVCSAGEKESMAQHMAFVHGTVQAAGELLYETEVPAPPLLTEGLRSGVGAYISV